MILGFTGTQKGMTPLQRDKVIELLSVFQPNEVHHGNCIGADEEMVAICYAREIRTIAHPGDTSPYKQTNIASSVTLAPKPNLERNRDIVRVSKIMFIAPKGFQEERRSGTWATYRNARGLRRLILIIYPDGSHKVEY